MTVTIVLWTSFEPSNEGEIKGPAVDPDLYPKFQVCEGANDVTVKTEDFGRANIFYDDGKLFDNQEPFEMTAEAWEGVLQGVLEAWGLAEAVSLHPDQMNTLTSCSMKTLKQLRNWSYIRATGHYPPSDTKPSEKATKKDLAWAAKSFDD